MECPLTAVGLPEVRSPIVQSRERLGDSAMGIIEGLVGHATGVNIDEAKEEFEGMLVRGEEVLSAYSGLGTR